MAIQHLFTPIGPTAHLAVTTSTARTPRPAVDNGGAMIEVRLCNIGTVPVFVAFGNSTVDAVSTTHIPIMPGMAEKFAMTPGQTHIAAVTASGTSTLCITAGLGR